MKYVSPSISTQITLIVDFKQYALYVSIQMYKKKKKKVFKWKPGFALLMLY
jgi:hypothetical protein